MPGDAPSTGTEAIIEIRTPGGGDQVDLEKCSLCEPPTRVECEKRCPPPVA